LKLTLMNEFGMAMALLERPVSGVFDVFMTAFLLNGTLAAVDAGTLTVVGASLDAVSISSCGRSEARFLVYKRLVR
jgi:hypothetical protein